MNGNDFAIPKASHTSELDMADKMEAFIQDSLPPNLSKNNLLKYRTRQYSMEAIS